MKKISTLFFLILLASIISSCSSSTSSSAPTIPEATYASSIGSLAQNSISISSSVQEGAGISSKDINALDTYDFSSPEAGADNWWEMSISYTSGSYTYEVSSQFKVWTANGEVDSLAELNNLNGEDITKLWIYAVYDVDYLTTSIDINIGESKNNPFKINYSEETLSGPLDYSASSASTTYAVSLTYDLTLAGGASYPSGTVNLTISEDSTQVCTATITFNGTSTATLAFSDGYSGTYTINLDSGEVTARGI